MFKIDEKAYIYFLKVISIDSIALLFDKQLMQGFCYKKDKQLRYKSSHHPKKSLESAALKELQFPSNIRVDSYHTDKYIHRMAIGTTKDVLTEVSASDVHFPTVDEKFSNEEGLRQVGTV